MDFASRGIISLLIQMLLGIRYFSNSYLFHDEIRFDDIKEYHDIDIEKFRGLSKKYYLYE